MDGAMINGEGCRNSVSTDREDGEIHRFQLHREQVEALAGGSEFVSMRFGHRTYVVTVKPEESRCCCCCKCKGRG